MQELNAVEIDEISGGSAGTVAATIIIVGAAILVGAGFIDGWKGEEKKKEQDRKKNK
jgi:hypothetical protein